MFFLGASGLLYIIDLEIYVELQSCEIAHNVYKEDSTYLFILVQ